jgi:hypothetical protein
MSKTSGKKSLAKIPYLPTHGLVAQEPTNSAAPVF